MNRFFMLLLLTACGRHAPHEATRSDVPAELSALADTYAGLQDRVADARGWTDTSRCDALLWASLRAASGVDVDVPAAEASSGRWVRRPADLPDCLSTGEADSSISRDMLLGVLWYAWTANDAGIVARMYRYGLSHGWVMGSGNPGATVLNPSMLLLLSKVCLALHADCPGAGIVAAVTPQVYTDPAPSGFVRHLETLQILLRGEIDGALPPALVSRLRRHRDEEPGNPLFLAATSVWAGDTADMGVLLSPWPTNRLPDATDWCSSWRVEAEAGSDGAAPCNDKDADGSPRKHSGGEILFLRRILRGK